MGVITLVEIDQHNAAIPWARIQENLLHQHMGRPNMTAKGRIQVIGISIGQRYPGRPPVL